MLPESWEVHETAIDELDVLALDELEDLFGVHFQSLLSHVFQSDQRWAGLWETFGRFDIEPRIIKISGWKVIGVGEAEFVWVI